MANAPTRHANPSHHSEDFMPSTLSRRLSLATLSMLTLAELRSAAAGPATAQC